MAKLQRSQGNGLIVLSEIVQGITKFEEVLSRLDEADDEAQHYFAQSH